MLPPPLAHEQELARLRHAVDELALPNELAVALGTARDLDAAAHTLVRGSLAAEQGVVTSEPLGPRPIRGRSRVLDLYRLA